MRAAILMLLATACAVEPTIVWQDPVEASVQAVFTYQPWDRLLVTSTDPDRDQCVGVLLGRDLEDGVPGLQLELPEGWGVELAYRSEPARGCHERFPQAHNVDTADSAGGLVNWNDTDPEAAPQEVDVDLRMLFVFRPRDATIQADDVEVEARRAP